MMEVMEAVGISPQGLEHVLNYDNITIVVLFVMMLLQWAVIGKLLSILFGFRDVLQNLAVAISILNERLHKED